MGLTLLNKSQRRSTYTSAKMVIFGPYGIGKTSLLKTLDVPTLCLDLEAGMLAVQDWEGDSIAMRTWEEARAIACLLGGPNPAYRWDQPYSAEHYAHVLALYPSILPEKYQCIFIDSITVASRLCFLWAKTQPEVFSEKKQTLDIRAAYGLLAQEMLAWIEQLQHIKDKDIVLVGLLEERPEEGRWVPQCEGNKTMQQLPGIVDEVISMIAISEEKIGKRIFVCRTLNPYHCPAKDRSGRLDTEEEPHLGKLLAKIKATLPI